MTKKNVKYQGLSIPLPIINKIKEHIDMHEEYTSVTNFIREAIKEKMYNDKFMAKEVPVPGHPGKTMLVSPGEDISTVLDDLRKDNEKFKKDIIGEIKELLKNKKNINGKVTA